MSASGVHYAGKSNSEGIYAVSNLPLGPYRMQVAKIGFKSLLKPDIILNTQDALAINFTLPLGATLETVTVEGGAPLVHTESGSVSTVIDRKLVENLPLNGRSFNTLLQLTPGVVIAPSGSNNQGQFSISGQRTTSNNFLVDGVSANFGVAPTFGVGTSGTGSAQAFSALGGTSSLVSVEALEEFRVETSSFAPEFGRSPGGQVMLTTRSGNNDPHGGVYEYFRNDVFDANDWFANLAGKPRAAERHNDFGGFFGGPLHMDRTFLFLSYEGAGLRQPDTRTVEVPSAYARAVAASTIAPYLDAYPQPDDRMIVDGVYTAPFTGNFSNPSTLNAGSVRIDHVFGHGISIFGRYNEAPSATTQRSQSLNETDTSEAGTRTITLGLTLTPSDRWSDAFRANYSLQNSNFVSALDSFGGAVPLTPSALAPGLADPAQALLGFDTFDTGIYLTGPDAKNRSTQLNFANDLTATYGAHQWKFGVDYRAIYLDVRPFQSSITYEADSVASLVASGSAAYLLGSSARPSYFLSRATSLYGQDTWRVTPRLTLTYGLRWELNPAPSARAGTILAAWKNVNDPAQISLSPAGTTLWRTGYTNFAPRFGVAYSLSPRGDLVLRAGAGIFYDLSSDAVGGLAEAFPNYASSFTFNVNLPPGDVSPYLPEVTRDPPYPNLTTGFAPDLKLPRSYQWNIAVEKAWRGQQALSVTYVGQAGRDLLRQEGLSQPTPDFSGAFLLTQNNARSNYHALELQYRRPVASHLQALLNYTWAHSLDNASSDVVEAVASTVLSAAHDHASSDVDVRQSFSGALSYEIPSWNRSEILQHLTRDWSAEALVVARSGFPYNAIVETATIGSAYPRPDRIPGQPVYLYGALCRDFYQSPCAGGQALNPSAFATPPAGQQGTEGRNDIPGFGLTQLDVSLARRMRISHRLDLQFRTDAFNLLNHPNFTNPLAYYLGPSVTIYLQSTQMLNHGLGGLNSVFQEGGPRSLQLCRRLRMARWPFSRLTARSLSSS